MCVAYDCNVISKCCLSKEASVSAARHGVWTQIVSVDARVNTLSRAVQNSSGSAQRDTVLCMAIQ
jgi:hypothetical protein